VDWKIKSNRIYVGDPVFTGDHGKQGIIYPGFKGVGSSIFFKPFHDYLERCLAQADFVAFIGFAFRDEYINASISNNLNIGAKVWILNPAIVNFPASRAEVVQIQKPFDASTGTELALTALAVPIKRTRRLI
jgi:hypothetical protein